MLHCQDRNVMIPTSNCNTIVIISRYNYFVRWMGFPALV